jgi:hypothetical protein
VPSILCRIFQFANKFEDSSVDSACTWITECSAWTNCMDSGSAWTKCMDSGSNGQSAKFVYKTDVLVVLGMQDCRTDYQGQEKTNPSCLLYNSLGLGVASNRVTFAGASDYSCTAPPPPPSPSPPPPPPPAIPAGAQSRPFKLANSIRKIRTFGPSTLQITDPARFIPQFQEPSHSSPFFFLLPFSFSRFCHPDFIQVSNQLQFSRLYIGLILTL